MPPKLTINYRIRKFNSGAQPAAGKQNQAAAKAVAPRGALLKRSHLEPLCVETSREIPSRDDAPYWRKKAAEAKAV